MLPSVPLAPLAAYPSPVPSPYAAVTNMPPGNPVARVSWSSATRYRNARSRWLGNAPASPCAAEGKLVGAIDPLGPKYLVGSAASHALLMKSLSVALAIHTLTVVGELQVQVCELP